MVTCVKCGTPNPGGGGYCGSCGSALPAEREAGSHKVRIVPAGGGESRILELTSGEWLVGRDPECSLVLDDPFVSPQHARFVAGLRTRR